MSASTSLDKEVPAKSNDVKKFLVREHGFSFEWGKGSHMVFRKEGYDTISFPNDRVVSPGVRRQIRDILKYKRLVNRK